MAAFEVEQIRAAEASTGGDTAARAWGFAMAGDIQRFLERPMEGESIPGQPAVPPGSPIGDPGLEWLTPPPQGVLITGDTGLTCSFAGGGF